MSKPQPKIITPTIGRRLWYYPSTYDLGGMLEKPSTIIEANQTQPCDAGVVFVHGDRLVNLSVTDHNGNVHKRTSVTLYQPGDHISHANGGYAVWMDYQKDQATPKPQGSTTEKYFAFGHLPAHLQTVSKPLGQLAELLEVLLPNGPEKSAGMRKLLEAKDCFVRAALDMQPAELLEKAPITDTDRLDAWAWVIFHSSESGFDELKTKLENVLVIEATNEVEVLQGFKARMDAVVKHRRSPKLNTEDPDHAQD